MVKAMKLNSSCLNKLLFLKKTKQWPSYSLFHTTTVLPNLSCLRGKKKQNKKNTKNTHIHMQSFEYIIQLLAQRLLEHKGHLHYCTWSTWTGRLVCHNTDSTSHRATESKSLTLSALSYSLGVDLLIENSNSMERSFPISSAKCAAIKTCYLV